MSVQNNSEIFYGNGKMLSIVFKEENGLVMSYTTDSKAELCFSIQSGYFTTKTIPDGISMTTYNYDDVSGNEFTLAMNINGNFSFTQSNNFLTLKTQSGTITISIPAGMFSLHSTDNLFQSLGVKFAVFYQNEFYLERFNNDPNFKCVYSNNDVSIFSVYEVN